MTHNEDENIFHKLIEIQNNPHYYFDYKQQARHLEDLTSYLKKEKIFKQEAETPTCHSNRTTTTDPDSAYMFVPAYTGTIKFD